MRHVHDYYEHQEITITAVKLCVMSHLGCVHIGSLKASSDESSGNEYQHCHGDPVAKTKKGDLE